MNIKRTASIVSIFGRRLVELRKGCQMTQAELAGKLGLSRNMISYYESWAKNPTLEAVQKVADFFGVPPEKLISEPETAKEKPGPASRLEQQIHRIKRLSPVKQRMIGDMLEAALNAK